MSRPTFYVSQDSSDSLDLDPHGTPKIKVSHDTEHGCQTCPKHRKHLRRHRLPASVKKLDIVRTPEVQDLEAKKEPKKVKKRQKSRRSHSITTQPNHELEVLKRWKLQQCPEDKRNETLKADNADNTLPRTLSTSVLRIKHRRNFWERFAR